MEKDLTAALAGIKLFEGLPENQLASLASIASFRRCASGQILFEAGQPGTHFYAVASGKVRIYRSSPSGKELVSSPRREFVEALRREPELALGVMALLSARLRAFVGQIAQLGLKEVPARLAGYLLLLRASQGRDDLTLELPKGQIAAYLGTIPETFSRALKKLVDQGLIESAGANIRILDAEGLSAVAEAGS